MLKEGDRFQHASNLNQDWPSGRGVFHNDAKSLLVWVNGEDQLQIISMQNGSGVVEMFDRMVRALDNIEATCQYLRDDHLGFVTTCPSNLGTALDVSVHIKLKKFAARKNHFMAIANKYQVRVKPVKTGVFSICNAKKLGSTENMILYGML